MEADMEARREALKGGNGGKSIEGDAESKHWINAIAFIWLLLTLVMIAGLCVRPASGDVNQACFQRRMSEEHALMEAFFQNPPEQNALTRAIHACSR
jgi:hypothetical protein